MCTIQSKSGSSNIGEAFIKDGNFGSSDQNLIKIKYHKANSLDILPIFKAYGIDIGQHIKKICCPLPQHKDGTASFYYYSQTNSFFCYGCKVGGGPVELVSSILDIPKPEASEIILSSFSGNANMQIAIIKDFAYRQETILNFSNYIRDIRNQDSSTSKTLDEICLIFDTLMSKHSLDNDGVKSLIKKLKVKINVS